jgi:undecaprenyl-diphosphatase
MTIIDSIVLGIIEGITEFLPISSTGHLILANEILGIQSTEFVKSFDIAIQLGAILSVVALYWRSFLDIEIVKRLLVAFIPTGIIGLAAYGVVKAYLLDNNIVVLFALALGGLALIIFELLHQEPEGATESVRQMNYKQSALIGLFQAIAIVPGVSRSAATIVGGLLLGIKRVTIVEFSFLLAVPTMLAATGLDVLKTSATFSGSEIMALAIGFVTAFFVALLSIKFLLSYVRNHSFIAFGVYRIVIALAFFVFVVW